MMIPSLQTLYFNQFKFEKIESFKQCSFPKLKELTFSNVTANDFPLFDAPLLATLTISYCDFHKIDGLEKNIFVSLTTLELNNNDLKEDGPVLHKI